MTDTIKSLCTTCKKHCPSNLKTELALRKNLTYIYLNNGNKIINGCNQFTDGVFQKGIKAIVTPQPEAAIVAHPPKLNFNTNLNLANFLSLSAKI